MKYYLDKIKKDTKETWLMLEKQIEKDHANPFNKRINEQIKMGGN